MMTLHISMDKVVEAYVEVALSQTSRQCSADVQEELTGHIKDKVADLQASGMTAERAFAKAVMSMGDINELAETPYETAAPAMERTAVAIAPAAGIWVAGLVGLFGAFKGLYLLGVIDLF